MGCHCALKAGSLVLETWRDDIDPAVMMLFVSSDKEVRPITCDQWEAHGGDREEWSSDLSEVEYCCRASEMIDRLELKGYTLSVAKEAFRLGTKRRISDLTASLEQPRAMLNDDRLAQPASRNVEQFATDRRTLDILRQMSAEDWVSGVRSFRSSQSSKEYTRFEDVAHLSPAEQYVRVWSWTRFGFPGSDIRMFLRLVLSACDSRDVVTYDLTDLVLGECFDAKADMVAYSEYLISREYDISRTTIVLTEGTSDRWILEKSLKLLYPHLSAFFSFMDFDGVRLQGGAGSLANMVKAFAGAGVLNRIIAVFDNDTAGKIALKSLERISLPAQMKTVLLPDIALAQTYPTLGPSGITNMDINGMAASIELFLGEDIIRSTDGRLIPVQWKGYDSSMKQYQGELLNKSEVQEAFRRKVDACESGSASIQDYDWTDMRAIIDVLRCAFHTDDAEAHLEYETWAGSPD